MGGYAWVYDRQALDGPPGEENTALCAPAGGYASPPAAYGPGAAAAVGEARRSSHSCRSAVASRPSISSGVMTLGFDGFVWRERQDRGLWR